MSQINEEDNHLETLLSRNMVPIIDLGHCGIEEISIPSVINRVGLQLQKAFTEKGIAFLVNHGISDDQIRAGWEKFDHFLDLPAEEREKYNRKEGSNRGYVGPGIERFDGKTPELRHAFNICSLDPESLPHNELGNLAKILKSLASFILKALAAPLDIPPTFLLDTHSQMLCGEDANMSTLRMLYYPSVVEDEPGQEKEVIRCGAHVDYGTFTLLAQDSEGGLEVKLPGSEKWERVGHLPGAILINGGEILSLWTRQRYHALPHRVVVPEQKYIRARSRHSLAYFCHPNNATLITPNALFFPDGDKSESTSNERVYSALELIQKKFSETYGKQ
ncbi:UPF0676 protein C1494.01 [Drosophila willistoni]|uniref:UPF0676 protein C1494.01 n=1 Tax=Drosophila willistoni TaxID=7260 RepID=UPI00017D9429|nr:UPF0676 protein C1494.01 [Drosophila willistoni]